MIISCIYIIKSKAKPSNFYIGSAVHYLKRKSEHLRALRSGRHFNTRLLRHYNKYGEDDLVFEILERIDKVELLIETETSYIVTWEPCFNVCAFGRSALGIKRSEETKRKMSAWQTGEKKSASIQKGLQTKKERNFKVSEVTKEKLRLINTGNITSDETKAKISAAHKGMKRPARSEEWKVKQRASQILACTPERKAQISVSLTGKKQSAETVQKRISKNIGRKRTPEMRQRISDGINKYNANKKLVA